MKKILFICVLLVAVQLVAIITDPWVSRVEYGVGMTLSCQITVNGTPATVNDLLMVAVDNEVRAKADLQNIPTLPGSVGRNFLIQSADPTEVFNFYLWRPDEYQMWTTTFTLNSEPGGHVGNYLLIDFSAPTPSVHGRVTEGVDGHAIPNVEMIVRSIESNYDDSNFTTLVTNSDGEYCLPAILPGSNIGFEPRHPDYTFFPEYHMFLIVSTVIQCDIVAVPLSITDNTTALAQPRLNANYPNPFNPTTTISFDVALEGQVCVEVYNIKGQKVRVLADGEYGVGQHSVVWNGDDANGYSVGSGVYFYRMTSGEYNNIRKMILMK